MRCVVGVSLPVDSCTYFFPKFFILNSGRHTLAYPVCASTNHGFEQRMTMNALMSNFLPLNKAGRSRYRYTITLSNTPPSFLAVGFLLALGVALTDLIFLLGVFIGVLNDFGVAAPDMTFCTDMLVDAARLVSSSSSSES